MTAKASENVCQCEEVIPVVISTCSFRKLALVGKFLIKFSSLSAPTKIEELTAVFFRLIRLSVLLSLSELKEKRIWLRVASSAAASPLLSAVKNERKRKLSMLFS